MCTGTLGIQDLVTVAMGFLENERRGGPTWSPKPAGGGTLQPSPSTSDAHIMMYETVNGAVTQKEIPSSPPLYDDASASPQSRSSLLSSGRPRDASFAWVKRKKKTWQQKEEDRAERVAWQRSRIRFREQLRREEEARRQDTVSGASGVPTRRKGSQPRRRRASRAWTADVKLRPQRYIHKRRPPTLTSSRGQRVFTRSLFIRTDV